MWRSSFLCDTPHAVDGLIIPEGFKPVRRHRRVAYGMLDVSMPQIILDGAGIVPVRCQVIATCMTQLMGMGHKGQTSELP